MKQRTILVLLLILSATFVLSCITSRDIHVEISCEEFTENPTSIRNDFQIEVGDKIYIELCSNASTGFEWSYEMSVDNVIKEEGYDFEEPRSNMPGAAGIEIWTFEAIGQGTTVIDLKYSQPWDGGIKGEWTYVINVVVD